MRFTASQLTNLESVEVPLRFECIFYGPDQKKSTGAIKQMLLIQGNTTKIGAFIPFGQVPTTLYLADRRVVEPYVISKATNGNLLNLDSD